MIEALTPALMSVFSEGITALIFWFFCIKAKEQIINVVSASIEKCQKKPSGTLAFFVCQRTPQKRKFDETSVNIINAESK
ncbi:hypothetical protein [Elizabethkingia miricola]|uniref:Uncharacterized protein n=1 Tax=Elizabethkingia miricola TaxID=172045 RepID=A0ABD5B9N3_ELIMR|nr:hypothetical protein [Elizabethkingia miricola]MDQ8750632.1 hypothetical protein [Elizabethkingia miricola]